MVGANAIRAVLTAAWRSPCWRARASCRRPTRSTRSSARSGSCTCVLLVATLLLGTCEVLYDNSAQTFMPADRRDADLEQANGRMYSAEIVANQFARPAARQAAPRRRVRAADRVRRRRRSPSSAGLVFASWPRSAEPASGDRRPPSSAGRSRRSWPRGSAGCGTTSCCARSPSRSGSSTCSAASAAPWSCCAARRSWHIDVSSSACYSTAAAIGGVVGGWPASRSSSASAPGGSLGLTLWLGGGRHRRHRASCRTGRSSPCCWSSTMFTAVLWNVITVSLRQAVIPDRLLGRVNSVYRFFGWGAIPIGAPASAASSSPSSTDRSRGSGRCGCRGSSPASPSSSSPPSSPAPHDRPHRRRSGRRHGRGPRSGAVDPARPASLEQALRPVARSTGSLGDCARVLRVFGRPRDSR